MGKEPIIIQFDEDESFFTVLELICFNMGLKMHATAKNIEQARDLVRRIESKQLKVDIAIITDYLGNSFQDGSILAKKLRTLDPEIKIISYVTDPETEWGDLLALKGSKSAEKTMTMALEQLTGKKFKASNIPESEVE